MKYLALAISIFWAGAAMASDAKFANVTAASTGLNGDALSGGVRSEAIDCGANTWGSSEVSFQAVVTAGTSTTVTVSCEESVDNRTWVWLPYCTNAAASSCTKQTLVYDLTSFTSFAVVIKPRARYLRCTFEDTGAGTGTITATATRISL